MKIKTITAREILDSRGWPTIACALVLDSGQCVHTSVPSGASTGAHEAIELRDGDAMRFQGRGVTMAVALINEKIAPQFVGIAPDVTSCDTAIKKLDGTSDKSVLGANTMLAVSMAMARAQAAIEGIPLYALLQKLSDHTSFEMPRAMFNILNGGAHAHNGIVFQEFMIMPIRKGSFAESLRMATSVYHALAKILIESGYQAAVGDEGGFAPVLKSKGLQKEHEALRLLVRAIEAAGFIPGKDIVICLDIAASQFFDTKANVYCLYNERLEAATLIDLYKDLLAQYPIVSIEDGLSEGDWAGWKQLTHVLGDSAQLVGDDIFVSNAAYLQKGIQHAAANALIIKPNQVGTVSEALETVRLAKQHSYKIIASHRSGETCDTFIADFAVAVHAEQCKAGAPARGERIAKYNRLLEIEAEIGR